MLKRIIDFVPVLILLLFIGCAPSQMSLSPEHTNKINPMGIYIVSSSQGSDNKDFVEKQYITSVLSESLPPYFQTKGYSVKLLNNKINTQRVFSKSSISYYIDEDKIARIAKENGCETVMIIYYAYYIRQGFIGNNLNVYNRISAYGWLVRTKDAEVLSSSHLVLQLFDDPNQLINPTDEEVNILYKNFLFNLSREMFENLPVIKVN